MQIPVPPPVELTVASFNAHWGVDARGRPFDVGAAARSLGADLLVVQEVWRPHRGPVVHRRGRGGDPPARS